MDTIQTLAENIFGTHEDRREILRAVVCLLARDIPPTEARRRRSKTLLQGSYPFLHAFYHVFDNKLNEAAIEAYCEVLDHLEIGRATRREILHHLIHYIDRYGDNVALSIKKTLIKHGVAWDGVDLNRLLYVVQLYPTVENLEKLNIYCKIADYKVHLSSREFGLVPFLLSATVEYNAMNSEFYGTAVIVLQNLLHPTKSRDYLGYIIERIIVLYPDTKTHINILNICCSLICTFFAKRRAEYLDVFQKNSAFYRKIAHIIQRGEFHHYNSPEGWCVYILLYSIMSDVKPRDEMQRLIETADIIRVYTKTASNLNIVALMASLILIFSGTQQVQEEQGDIDKVMQIVPVKTYKILVDILENILYSRGGKGYGDRTFTMDFILMCIWRVVLIDEINYSIIGARLLGVLHKILERFYYERTVGRDIYRIVLHILEYSIPYCLSYDFTDYATVIELKKLKSILVKLGGSDEDAKIRESPRSRHLTLSEIENLRGDNEVNSKFHRGSKKFREMEDIEIENITIAYIISVLTFTPNSPVSAVALPYKSSTSSGRHAAAIEGSDKYRQGVKISGSPPVAVPVTIPTILYFAEDVDVAAEISP